MTPIVGHTFIIAMIALLASNRPINISWVRETSLGVWDAHGRDFFMTNKLILNSSNTMVMVSFNPLGRFAQELENDNRTQAYFASLSTGVGRALLQVKSPIEREQLAAKVHGDISACGGLEEYIPHLNLTALGDASSPAIPTSLGFSKISSLLDNVSTSNLEKTTTALQNLGTRYQNGNSPSAASDLVESTWSAGSPSKSVISQFDHLSSKGTNQKSVILKIPGVKETDKTVILGAHLDSINSSDQSNAPGADDNASGIAALTEVLRVLKENNATFSRNIEIHAYAAEESGLLGSADIAENYLDSSVNVVAMLQLDMIGYSDTSGDKTLHLISTDTSPVLLRHLKDLTSNYLDGTWTVGTLSAGTSDHRSWTRRGFHSAFPFEHPTKYNHALHTANDKIDRIDFSLASRFTKLALAFLCHEAGLTGTNDEVDAAWSADKLTADSLKIAISSSSSGSQKMAISTSDLNTTSIEICKVASGSEFGCQSLNTDTTLADEKSKRLFFVSATDLIIANQDIWRINAYNANGKLIAMRTVKLKKLDNFSQHAVK